MFVGNEVEKRSKVGAEVSEAVRIFVDEFAPHARQVTALDMHPGLASNPFLQRAPAGLVFFQCVFSKLAPACIVDHSTRTFPNTSPLRKRLAPTQELR